MILTDGTYVVSTESLQELHDWAERFGVSSHHFHGTRQGRPHYALPQHRKFLLPILKKCSTQEALQYAQGLSKRKEASSV